MESFRAEKVYDRIVFPVPENAYHLDASNKYANPDKKWVGIHWPDGLFTIVLMNEEESERWLKGEDLDG